MKSNIILIVAGIFLLGYVAGMLTTIDFTSDDDVDYHAEAQVRADEIRKKAKLQAYMHKQLIDNWEASRKLKKSLKEKDHGNK